MTEHCSRGWDLATLVQSQLGSHLFFEPLRTNRKIWGGFKVRLSHNHLCNFEDGLASAIPGHYSQGKALKLGAHIAIDVVFAFGRVDLIGFVPEDGFFSNKTRLCAPVNISQRAAR